MARIRRYRLAADDLTPKQVIEEIMVGPTGDPKDLERMRRYYDRRGELSSPCFRAYQAEHDALVARGRAVKT